MRKLALNDEILLNIEKPARYIGNEINSVMKDKEKVAIRFAMCFPDVYEIGMSHLGIQILYDMLIGERMSGANGFILRGSIWTRSCGSNIFHCSLWNPRIRSGFRFSRNYDPV